MGLGLRVRRFRQQGFNIQVWGVLLTFAVPKGPYTRDAQWFGGLEVPTYLQLDAHIPMTHGRLTSSNSALTRMSNTVFLVGLSPIGHHMDYDSLF